MTVPVASSPAGDGPDVAPLRPEGLRPEGPLSGCGKFLGCGCLALLAFFVAAVALTTVGTWAAYRWAYGYTSEAPLPIPDPPDPAAAEAVRKRIEAFARDLGARGGAGREAHLVLTEEDINALFAEGGDTARLHVRLRDDGGADVKVSVEEYRQAVYESLNQDLRERLPWLRRVRGARIEAKRLELSG